MAINFSSFFPGFSKKSQGKNPVRKERVVWMMIFLRVGVLTLGDVGKLTMFHGCPPAQHHAVHFPPAFVSKNRAKSILSIESCLVDQGILIISMAYSILIPIWGFPKMVVPNNHGFSY